MVHPSAELPGSAVVIRPGDRVLVALRDADWRDDDLDRMEAQISAQFPGVRFVVVHGVAALAVQRAEEDTP